MFSLLFMSKSPAFKLYNNRLQCFFVKFLLFRYLVESLVPVNSSFTESLMYKLVNFKCENEFVKGYDVYSCRNKVRLSPYFVII